PPRATCRRSRHCLSHPHGRRTTCHDPAGPRDNEEVDGVTRRLPLVAALAGLAVASAGCGGSARTASGTTTTAGPHAAGKPAHRRAPQHRSPAEVALGLPPVPRGPVPGYV